MASAESASSPIAIASPASVSSIGSPCPTLAPRASPALQTQPENPGIITHKEWVVPPRPKPGRKPATDTPPTKRKAQNRAAQRAFRERRAARVNELEEQLKEVNSEAETRNQEYKEQIAQLTKNNTELAKENASYKLKIETLLRELQEATAAAATKTELTQVASPAPSSGTADAPCGGDCSCQDFIDKALCNRPNATEAVSISPAKRNVRKEPELQGCGSCSKDGECACYNEATAIPLPKRATSPITNAPKRSRITVDYLDDLETDFTAAYMSRPVSSRGTPGSLTHMPDPCGFCSDGTPCVCAEMANAMDMEDSDTDEEQRDVKLAPILGSGEFGILSPPNSSTGDSVPLRRMMGLDRPLPLHPPTGVRATPKISTSPSSSSSSSSSSTGCKPGGCDQCKADPMSTLFCQSVATRIRSSGSGGCCGGNAGGAGGCCKDIESAIPTAPKRNTHSSGDGKTYIPCSAVYQTLSRHRAFDEAAADLGALVRPLVIQSVDGSCPQVEVSSVRDVLKMLDRRFGRD
ncbi:hypothetical protein K440DRAFT_576896 [Wilcoxina mikolae CBS 423.85]|nr:hypothetical protein K440DRAFT_576896 [Wilcoxina mikolae CBS 423.85]